MPTIILIACFLYILGALLTLKIDAMWNNRATDWSDWWCALIGWVPIGILMVCTKHAIYHEHTPTRDWQY